MTIGTENVGDMDLLDISIVTGVDSGVSLTEEEIIQYQQKSNPQFTVEGNALTQEYKDALTAYKVEGYERINDVLRDPIRLRETLTGFELDETVGIINNLDSAISLAPPLPQAITSYRGVRGSAAERFDSMDIGTIFRDDGFVSTTLNEGVAQGFAIGGGEYSVAEQTVIKIISPKGQRGVMLDSFSGELGEEEWLLPRGLKFEVISKAEDGITVRVLP
jgi:hypothetical protein